MDKQYNGKPLQRVSYTEKIANNHEYFKRTADYYISQARFDDTKDTSGGKSRDRKMLYGIYNNQFPMEFFDHVVNPYNSDKQEHQKWPAKIRPTTILRTNMDQLMSEYPKRPFSFYCENLSDDAYNMYTEGLNDVINQTLQRKFIQIAQAQAAAEGQSLGPEAEHIAANPVPEPAEVATAYKAGYKDKQAIKGQKRLNRLIAEVGARNTFQKMFKDWVIVGEPRSYKGVHNGVLTYKRISPLNFDCDKSEDVTMFEDGEWQVARYFYTYSDIVDLFYDDLSEQEHDDLEKSKVNGSTPRGFFDSLKGLYTDKEAMSGKVVVYHAVWKGKQLLKKVTMPDPMTGEDLIDYFDEDYVLEPGQTSENIWVNCGYETYRIGDDIYVRMQELENQRNELNNFKMKLPYNGKNFSDTHSANISLTEIGLPFQILYIIVTRALEMTIAKSKGKIVLLDKNVIPTKDGWDEDKFFYYSEALGWGLIDRNKMGVDKSFNQYQVLDLTLYDSIQQLIQLQQHLKDEWDDILGFTRQRKGQTFASDTMGSNSEALFQSTVITDMIFIGFEEFIESDLQGILDLSKFVDVTGVRKLYNESELDYETFEADPLDIAMSSIGVVMTKHETDKLKKMEAYAGQLAMNGAKPSTVIELITADNLAGLKAVLKKTEDLEAQAAQAMQENEQQGAQQVEEIRMRYMQAEKQLDIQFMNEEYNRKVEIEHIKGSYAGMRNKEGNDGDQNDNGIPDSAEIFAQSQARDELMYTNLQKNKDRNQEHFNKQQEMQLKAQEIKTKAAAEIAKAKIGVIQQANAAHKLRLEAAKIKLDAQNRDLDRQSKERIEKLKASTALKNKTSGER
jgi:hypothetical protein